MNAITNINVFLMDIIITCKGHLLGKLVFCLKAIPDSSTRVRGPIISFKPLNHANIQPNQGKFYRDVVLRCLNPVRTPNSVSSTHIFRNAKTTTTPAEDRKNSKTLLTWKWWKNVQLNWNSFWRTFLSIDAWNGYFSIEFVSLCHLAKMLIEVRSVWQQFSKLASLVSKFF